METCRELLPTSIAKALDLDDFDVTSALETTGKSSDAIKNEFNGPVNGCVTAIAEEGLALLAFLVEQDHAAMQNRAADTCDYERSDRISRRIATHRMSEPITKIKRLISLRQRTSR